MAGSKAGSKGGSASKSGKAAGTPTALGTQATGASPVLMIGIAVVVVVAAAAALVLTFGMGKKEPVYSEDPASELDGKGKRAIFGQNENRNDIDCFEGDGKGYSGNISTTMGGYTCQRWDVLIPNAHPYVRNYFRTKKDFHSNYCRNPTYIFGVKVLWCFITMIDPFKYESCNIPRCDEPKPLPENGPLEVCKYELLFGWKVLDCPHLDNVRRPLALALETFNFTKAEWHNYRIGHFMKEVHLMDNTVMKYCGLYIKDKLKVLPDLTAIIYSGGGIKCHGRYYYGYLSVSAKAGELSCKRDRLLLATFPRCRGRCKYPCRTAKVRKTLMLNSIKSYIRKAALCYCH